MIWVWLLLGVVMVTGICKLIGTVTVFMYVESVEGGNGGRNSGRQIKKFSIEKKALLGCIIKLYNT